MQYVIVKTTNTERGEDSVLAIYGPFDWHADADEVCQNLRANLPSEYADHADNPIDYGVIRVDSI